MSHRSSAILDARPARFSRAFHSLCTLPRLQKIASCRRFRFLLRTAAQGVSHPCTPRSHTSAPVRRSAAGSRAGAVGSQQTKVPAFRILVRFVGTFFFCLVVLGGARCSRALPFSLGARFRGVSPSIPHCSAVFPSYPASSRPIPFCHLFC